ncbi:DUF2007 domain-containing protein [Muricauda sp. SCSIO 64092]|uniref:putative signal transducing protein n=1 Tax=Allomuricauda sp. SCSIO 64092 TaxID=2908842 RepID=UPI001FF51ED6|nr:DUF2007 domain-containing protein [Muricauda sp. SCSIO 64092]UOY04699.1 DUF2007 domain-containing protein [Muricauda sp. SCSIO 64092]
MKNEFYTITSSTYPADIQILKGKLESEGIQVFLRDENTVNTDPLISDAIGGVKLQVYESDKEKAIAIYKQLKSYVTDEEGNLVACKICGRKQLEVIYLRNNILYKLFPFFEPKKYRCDNCNFLSKSIK